MRGIFGDCRVRVRARVAMTILAAAGVASACVTGGGGFTVIDQSGRNNLYPPSPVPVSVNNISDAAEVSVGKTHVCARRDTGEVVCWGLAGDGQMGDGTEYEVVEQLTAIRPEPTNPVAGVGEAVALDSGDRDSCVVRETGIVSCWGFALNGAIGTVSRAWAPVDISVLTTAVEVTAGSKNTCARLDDGTAYCWGSDQYGQLGDAVWDYDTSFPRHPVFGIEDAVSIDLGSFHGCVRRSSGEVWCWGDNSGTQLGLPADDSTSGQPVHLPGADGALDLSTGGKTTCIIRSNGEVACIGENYLNPMGTVFNPGGDPFPVLTDIGISDAVDLSIGATHGCAVLGSGHVACWGDDSLGKLGDGDVLNPWRSGPSEVVGLTDAVQVSVGDYNSCALRVNGQVACWGGDGNGQLGDGL